MKLKFGDKIKVFGKQGIFVSYEYKKKYVRFVSRTGVIVNVLNGKYIKKGWKVKK